MKAGLRHRLPWRSLIRHGSAASATSSGLVSPIDLLQPAACRLAHNAADKPGFKSILDEEARLVSAEKKRNPGLYLLILMPITAFLLGSWQVKRLEWKTDLVTKFEDRILKPPLPLPPIIDPTVVKDFDYRRIYVEGEFRFDQEMLIGPRIHDGKDGFLVVTPLERKGGSKVLVNRGWIARGKEMQRDRPKGVKRERVVVQGLLREPFKKNLFTPDNKPEDGKWYFPDVKQMAEASGSEPIWIEETMVQDLIRSYDREAAGIPIGRPAAVNLRNNHTQYIFTWYSLSLATSIMFWRIMRKPPPDVAKKVRLKSEWS